MSSANPGTSRNFVGFLFISWSLLSAWCAIFYCSSDAFFYEFFYDINISNRLSARNNNYTIWGILIAHAGLMMRTHPGCSVTWKSNFAALFGRGLKPESSETATRAVTGSSNHHVRPHYHQVNMASALTGVTQSVASFNAILFCCKTLSLSPASKQKYRCGCGIRGCQLVM